MNDLQDILDGEETKEETKAVEPEVKAEEPAPESTPEPEPEEPSKPEPAEKGLEAALVEERRKRQALEQEREFWSELKAKKEEQPDPLDDPEGAYRNLSETVDRRILNERLNMSEMIHRQNKGDGAVDEAVAAWSEAVRQNPGMQQQAMQQHDPYGYVLKWHEQQSQIAEIGNLDEWKANTREALKAELMAELKADQPIPQPTDMSDVPSQPPKTRGFNGPTPLDEIFN